jgi:hypothetical protein
MLYVSSLYSLVKSVTLVEDCYNSASKFKSSLYITSL